MTETPQLVPNGTAAPFGDRVPAHRTAEGAVYVWGGDGPDGGFALLDEDYGDAGFVFERRLVTWTVTATATPSLTGRFDNEQAQVLARAAFEQALTGVTGGFVWLVRSEVGGFDARDSESWLVPDDFDSDPDVVAWAEFGCSDPTTEVTL